MKDPVGTLEQKRRGYSTREVARLLGVSAQRIRGWIGQGLAHPGRSPQGHFRLSFQDILSLRRARDLTGAGVSPMRLARSLQRLRCTLPSQVAATSIRLEALAGKVVARLERQSWHPETGQVLLEFEPRRRCRLHTLSGPGPTFDGDASEWFDHALELEKVDTETSMDSYRQVLRREPQHLDAHLNLGRLLHEKGELLLAECHYRAALAVDPEAGICFYNLGVVLEDQSRQSEALEAYQKSISLDPNLRDAHYNLARLYERRGQRESALRHLTTYRQLSR